MNLAFVIKTLDSRGGGAERVITQITSSLAQRGHQITLVTFGRSDEPDFYAVDYAVRRICLASGNVQERTRISDLFVRIKRLKKAIQKIGPDVAIGFMHSAYVPLALALASSRIPVIASEHTVYDHFGDRVLDALSLRLTAPIYAAVTTISRAATAGFPGPFAKRMVVIPNPVLPVRERADPVGGRSKILLSVGRLDELKGQRTLIEAFARLAANRPEWTLRIVGDGAQREELRTLIADLDLANRIQLPGVIKDIQSEYRSAQLFAMPSRYESFGLATAEALAAGLPAVGFRDCPGTNELIQDRLNGLLVAGPNRVAAFAHGIRELMDSAALRRRLGNAGPASVSRFGLDAIVAKWEALLNHVTN